jgi:membrane-bound metal-dependent hydrolase YbcI (DUF457 family)
LDNLTHSLFGATLGRTPLGRAGRGTTATLVIASNAPDIDIAAAAGGSLKYLEWHRGMTHGPLGLMVLAVVSAVLVRSVLTAWDRYHADMPVGESGRPIAPLHLLVAIAFVAIVFHVLMDLPTSYGTRLLSPFSWRWYAIEWMPIIDIYLWIVLASGLYLGRTSAEARRRNAGIVLVFVAAIYSVRGFMHHEALALAPRLFGPTLPARCDPPAAATPLDAVLDSWPKPVPSPPPPGRRCLIEIAALPTFFSPFDWRIVAQMSNSYEIHDVNVLDHRFRETEEGVFWRQSLRYPNIWTPDVERAAVSRTGQVFLGFSRFPAARTAHDSTGTAVVRFSDVRFAQGLGPSEQSVRRIQPFTITIRLDAAGRVVSETLGR